MKVFNTVLAGFGILPVLKMSIGDEFGLESMPTWKKKKLG